MWHRLPVPTAAAAMASRHVARGRRRRRHVLSLFLLGLLIWLASAPSVHALVVYRWTEPDGTVAYAQMPPDARDGPVVRRLQLVAVPGPVRPAPLHAAAGSLPTDASSPPPRSATRGVDDAWRQLQSAEQALRQGRTPTAADRRHLVDGHSRLTPEYFDRVSALEAAVQRARENLQAAVAARDAASGATNDVD